MYALLELLGSDSEMVSRSVVAVTDRGICPNTCNSDDAVGLEPSVPIVAKFGPVIIRLFVGVRN